MSRLTQIKEEKIAQDGYESEEMMLYRLLQSPKKEIVDPEYEIDLLDEKHTAFGQMIADAEANPHLDSEQVYVRHMYGPAAEARWLERQKPCEFYRSLINKAQPKSKELMGLQVAKTAGVSSSALPVTGKREKKKTWKQIEKEEVRKVNKEPVLKRSKQTDANATDAKPGPSSPPARKTRDLAKPIKNSTVPKKSKSEPPKMKYTPKKINLCPECHKISRRGTCFCNGCTEWVHLKCAKISARQWTVDFRCSGCSAK